MNIPIIRLEIEGMKQTIIQAITQHTAMMDSDIQAAVDRICTPEYISSLVVDVAQKEMASAIEREIKAFYSYGEGYQAIREAVATMFTKKDEEAQL